MLVKPEKRRMHVTIDQSTYIQWKAMCTDLDMRGHKVFETLVQLYHDPETFTDTSRHGMSFRDLILLYLDNKAVFESIRAISSTQTTTDDEPLDKLTRRAE